MSRRESINDILTVLGKKESIVHRALLIGGGRIGLRVAQLLEQEHLTTKLLERRADRC